MKREAHIGRWLRAGLMLLVVATCLQTTLGASEPKRVAANLVFWDQARGFEAIAANVDLLSEVTPVWYHLAADGTVKAYEKSKGTTYEDPAVLSFLRKAGVRVVPAVSNVVDGEWDGPLVSHIIADPQRMAAHVSNLVDLAVSRGYDGLDLDYESLAASDRAAFTAFVTHLAGALHAKGKVLTVNVHPKTSEPGTWGGPIAQDWAAIGAVADQVRVMMYDYHWSSSDAGPIAPVNWVAGVLSFARTMIPAGKIMQGVPFYGYDWVGRTGSPVVWGDAMALADKRGTTINWDRDSAAPWFQYSDQGGEHAVWFENATSVDAKLQLANAYGVGGVVVWRVGGEDPATWSALRSRFHRPSNPLTGGVPSTLVTAPALLASANGTGF